MRTITANGLLFIHHFLQVSWSMLPPQFIVQFGEPLHIATSPCVRLHLRLSPCLRLVRLHVRILRGFPPRLAGCAVQYMRGVHGRIDNSPATI